MMFARNRSLFETGFHIFILYFPPLLILEILRKARQLSDYVPPRYFPLRLFQSGSCLQIFPNYKSRFPASCLFRKCPWKCRDIYHSAWYEFFWRIPDFFPSSDSQGRQQNKAGHNLFRLSF